MPLASKQKKRYPPSTRISSTRRRKKYLIYIIDVTKLCNANIKIVSKWAMHKHIQFSLVLWLLFNVFKVFSQTLSFEMFYLIL